MTTFYTLEEVSKNNGKNGNRVWIVIKNNVYDPTEYLSEHPGGGDLILEWAGKDATKAFDDAGHSSDAKSELKQFKIGEIKKDDSKRNLVVEASSTRVTEAPLGKERRSCISYVTCGLCG